MLDVAAFITRNAIENYSLRFSNAQTQFVAEHIFQPLVVKNRDTKVWQYDNTFLKEAETRRDSRSAAELIDYGGFYRNVTLEQHKLAARIDPRDEADVDTVTGDIRTDSAEVIMQKLLIKRERMAATLVETTTNYPSALTATLSAGDTWLDAAGDPEEDAMTAHNAIALKCGRTANAAMLSGTSLRLLRTSPQFRERIKYTNAGPVSDEAIKAWLKVDHLFVGDSRYDSAVPGAAEAVGDIWADGILFFVHDPAVQKKSMCFGRMAIRNQLYSYEYLNNEMGSAAGRVRTLEMGWEFKLTPGFVASSSDSDFFAGYYLDNIV